MRSNTPLGVDYLTPDELGECRARGWPDVLGVALFSSGEVPVQATEVPLARIAMCPLGEQPAVCEVWRTAGPFTSGTAGLVHYRTNGEFVFGCVTLGEADTDSHADDGNGLRVASEHAYADVFRCLARLGFVHIIRIWNYLPGINREAGGLERYRHFNEARQRAFKSFRGLVNGNVPAACALGLPPGGLLAIYFLASADEGTAIESPRQIPAYDYPPQYGAFSPTFSRATLTRAPAQPMLFVSGTASIVGHRTVHAGNVLAQTRETLLNIRALVAEANRVAGRQLFTAEQLKYKAYLRHPGDRQIVVDELRQTLRPAAPIVYLNADVCRAELLVEIEAVGFGAQAQAH
jgi:enamine deaminase RidA (YjgF/YER057c/UK114 family)